MKERNSGVTLIALVVTIIVMGIIVSISAVAGGSILKNSKVQTLETELFAIQAKTKAYAEEIEAKIWTESDKDVARDNEFQKKHFISTSVSEEALNQVDNDIKSDYVSYKLTNESLEEMGLENIEAEQYIIIFSKNDYKKMDVIYASGISYSGQKYYTLSSLREILEN